MLTESKRRVFVYLQPEKTNLAVLKALKSLDAHVIAILPGIRAVATERLSNPFFQIYPHPVRLDGLIQHADIVITNAGQGLAAASLLAGVPMLLIPHNFEQVLTAKRIQSSGAVHVLSLDHVAERVLATIEGLLNDIGACNAAHAFSRKYSAFTQERVIARVTDAVELYVSNRSNRFNI